MWWGRSRPRIAPPAAAIFPSLRRHTAWTRAAATLVYAFPRGVSRECATWATMAACEPREHERSIIPRNTRLDVVPVRIEQERRVVIRCVVRAYGAHPDVEQLAAVRARHADARRKASVRWLWLENLRSGNERCQPGRAVFLMVASSDRLRQSLRRQVAAAPAREPSRTARCVAGSRAPEKNGIVQRTRRSCEQRTRARKSVGGVQAQKAVADRSGPPRLSSHQSAYRNARRSSFSRELSPVPRIRLKNSIVSSMVSSRPSWK